MVDLTIRHLLMKETLCLLKSLYLWLLNTFHYGAKLVGIPMEQDGMNISA
ncbi:MAG: hypothetical protein ACLS9K_10535 [Lachnospira eligens]